MGVGMTDFAAATDRSTPGFERLTIGHWILRTASGATGRANSATLNGDPGMAAATAVDRMEAWYGERGQPAKVMVWDATAPEVIAELERRGYTAGRPTDVMAAPLEQVWPGLHAPTRLRTRVETETPDLMRSLTRAERLGEMVHSNLERRFAVAFDDDGDVGTGMAMFDPPLVGIFAMRTRGDRQGEGAGSAVIRALLDGASNRGCGTAWLQVESDNHRANQWYARLGFVTRTSYDHWVAPFTAASPAGGADDTDNRPDSRQ